MKLTENDSVHLDKPIETSADPRVWDANKRAAFEKWATEYERLSMFGPGNFNNKITWSAYRAGVDYQASTNKDTATLAAYRTLIHTHHPAPDGSEFGFCRVRFDARGQVESCLWAGHDEVDAAVAALVEAESGISSLDRRPNEQNDFRCMEIGCGSTTEGVHHHTCPEAAAVQTEQPSLSDARAEFEAEYSEEYRQKLEQTIAKQDITEIMWMVWNRSRALLSAQRQNSEQSRLILEPMPLTEPVTIAKALLAHREATVWLNGGVGPEAMVALCNIGLTGWTHTKETAGSFAKGYNAALCDLRGALAQRQDSDKDAS